MTTRPLHISIKPRPIGLTPLGLVLSLPLFLLPLGVWLIDSSSLTLAQCGFKVLFGIPCMGCGGTRATLNILHGDWWEALTFQPLITLVYVGFAIWGAVSFISWMKGKEVEIELSRPLTWTLRGLLIFLPFANWGYLILRDI